MEVLRERHGEKAAERERVLGLFRRGRIDDVTDLIGGEAGALQAEIDVRTRALIAVDQAAQIRSAEELLVTLRTRLDGPILPELKRIAGTLVDSIQANTVEKWGVHQRELVITHRFSQPTESAALVVPRFHRLSPRSQAPEELITLGDHLRRLRMVLKLLQGQVAKQIDVCKQSVANWETGRPDFLGYDPLVRKNDWASRLVQGRLAAGLSQKEAASPRPASRRTQVAVGD